MDVNSLTDQELVAAANEYIQRVIRRARPYLSDSMTVMLYASSSSYKPDEYEIDHSLYYGEYANEVKLKGGNLFELLAKHQAIANIPTSPAVKVTPMLSAPEPEIEEAHFTEVPRNCFSGADDDAPF